MKSTLISGYDTFLDDEENSRTGETLEAAHDELISWGHPGYKSGLFAKRTEAVYDPWFKLMHGERSELPSALLGPPSQGPKIIAVTGATGSQGGGVVNIMKKTPGWKVRAITRNTGSDAAKKLAAEGIEVVSASFDDEASLRKAFEVSQRTPLRETSHLQITSRASMPCMPSQTGGSISSPAPHKKNPASKKKHKA